MKNILIVFLSGLLICGFTTNAHAGFVVKRHHTDDSTLTRTERLTKKQRKAEAREDREREWKKQHGEDNLYHKKEAKIAAHFALLGLILLPLGIPAIVHGIRSLKKEWYYRGVAISSVIFGGLEILLLAFLIVVLLFWLL